MIFLVLLAVGTATAAPAPQVHVLTEPPRNYVIVEPVPEAPIFPPLQYGIINQDQKAFDERFASGEGEGDANNAKPENIDADDATPSEDDADNANPKDDDGNDAKPVDDDANDAKPDASEHHEEQSETEKPISSPDDSKIPSPPEQVVISLRPVIRLDDTAPPAVSWLPSFIPAFQLPSLSSIPGLSGLSLPSLPSLSSLSLPSLPNLSSIGLPSLSSLNLPSISNFNLSNLSNFNIPGLSSIFGSSPKGRYIVYQSY